jgi:hypothetical protein
VEEPTVKAAHWILALLVVIATPPAALAESATREHRGKISAIDRVTRTFTVKASAESETFAVVDASRLVSESENATFDHLAIGQEVVVRTRAADSVKPHIAASIEIVDAPALIGQLEELDTTTVADTVTIVQTYPSARIIEVATRQGPLRYRVDDATRIRSSVEPLALADLALGQRVAISARRDGDVYVATEVVVVAVGPEPPPIDPPKEKEVRR